MAGKLISFIDRLVYSGDKENPDTFRKGRFFLVSTFLFILLCLSGFLYMTGNMKAENFSWVSFIAIIAMFIVAVALFLLYRSIGRRVIWVNVIMLAGYATNMGTYEQTGGIYSPDNLWGIIISAWAFLVADKRTGIFWFAITFCTYIFYHYALVHHWRDFKKDFETVDSSYFMINYCLACVFLAWIILLHEGGKEKYLKALLKAKSQIEEQKKIVDQRNKDVTDSIEYASKIQRARIPSDKYIEKCLKRLNGDRGNPPERV